MDRAEVDSRIRTLIEPFNKKDVAITCLLYTSPSPRD